MGGMQAVLTRSTLDIYADTPAAQLLRYVVVGGLSNAIYFALFLSAADYSNTAAIVAASVASTIVANELHRQVTFRVGERVSWWTAQRDGGGTALVSLIINEVAVNSINSVIPGASALSLACMTLALSAVIGGARFFVLRDWVFNPARA